MGLQTGTEIFRDVLRRKFDAAPRSSLVDEVGRRFLSTYPNFKPTERATFLVSSFSKVRDDLSQWRSYAGDAAGYMLGVRLGETPGLVAPAPAGKLGLGLFELVYRQARKVRLVACVIDRVLNAATELPPSVPFDDVAGLAALALYRCCGYVTQSMKHDSFKAEEEWRLTVLGEPDGAGALETMVRDTGETVRFVTLPLSQSQIVEVMVGPRAPRNAEDDVRAILRDVGLPAVGVTRSRSTYR